MSTIYRMKMSNGQHFERRAQSAAEAIQKALEANPGLMVAECHSGYTSAEAEASKKAGINAMAGAIFYDIPPHKPVQEAKPEVVE